MTKTINLILFISFEEDNVNCMHRHDLIRLLITSTLQWKELCVWNILTCLLSRAIGNTAQDLNYSMSELLHIWIPLQNMNIDTLKKIGNYKVSQPTITSNHLLSSFFSCSDGPTETISIFPIFFSFFAIATVSISPMTVNLCSFKSAAIESTPEIHEHVHGNDRFSSLHS